VGSCSCIRRFSYEEWRDICRAPGGEERTHRDGRGGYEEDVWLDWAQKVAASSDHAPFFDRSKEAGSELVHSIDENNRFKSL
jgi:hypothetical protein